MDTDEVSVVVGKVDEVNLDNSRGSPRSVIRLSVDQLKSVNEGDVWEDRMYMFPSQAVITALEAETRRITLNWQEGTALPTRSATDSVCK